MTAWFEVGFDGVEDPHDEDDEALLQKVVDRMNSGELPFGALEFVEAMQTRYEEYGRFTVNMRIVLKEMAKRDYDSEYGW